LNFVMSQILLETRMFRLSDGEEIMTLAFFVLIQYRSVTDGHSSSGYTSACIACYANALVKMSAPHIILAYLVRVYAKNFHSVNLMKF